MSSSRVLSSVISARIFWPSDVVTQAGRPPSVSENSVAAAAARRRVAGGLLDRAHRPGGCGRFGTGPVPKKAPLLPGEVDTAILRPARLIRSLRVQGAA